MPVELCPVEACLQSACRAVPLEPYQVYLSGFGASARNTSARRIVSAYLGLDLAAAGLLESVALHVPVEPCL